MTEGKTPINSGKIFKSIEATFTMTGDWGDFEPEKKEEKEQLFKYADFSQSIDPIPSPMVIKAAAEQKMSSKTYYKTFEEVPKSE